MVSLILLTGELNSIDRPVTIKCSAGLGPNIHMDTTRHAPLLQTMQHFLWQWHVTLPQCKDGSGMARGM